MSVVASAAAANDMLGLEYEVVCSSDDRSDWFVHRASGIGASEMAACMGESKWESALSVYARKTGVIVENEADQSEAAYWGSRLEQIVAEEFTRRTGVEHQWHGRLLRSKRFPWALATLDATALGEPLECKTANQYLTSDWANGAPLAYQIQAHQQMLVTGAKRCRVACLIGGQRFVWDIVERDETMIRRVIKHGNEMWDRIQRQDPPDPDGSDSSFDALDAMYRFQVDKSVELPGELIDLDNERVFAKEQIKTYTKRANEIEALIRARMGDAQKGRLANGVVYAISRVKRAAYECKATEYTQLRRLAPKGQ